MDPINDYLTLGDKPNWTREDYNPNRYTTLDMEKTQKLNLNMVHALCNTLNTPTHITMPPPIIMLLYGFSFGVNNIVLWSQLEYVTDNHGR